LHESGYGFDLSFQFEKNDYFTNEVLKKTFVMSKQNVIEKCDGTEIGWKEGRDVTKKKIKKKSKNKKAGAANKTVTKTVEQESFFNFFKTLNMPDEKELEGVGEEEEKDLGEKMDADFDLGNDFKDQLIPLALEYYMEVIDEEDDQGESDEDHSDCGEDHDHDHHHGHGHGPKKGGKKDEDSEEDKPKGAAKKKNAKKQGGNGAEGADK
jgi:nucleosome assembly protein 1-like 1